MERRTGAGATGGRGSATSRRGAVKVLVGGAAAGALAALGAGGVAAADDPFRIEPGAGRWKTWVLASGGELRLPPPPGDSITRAEIQGLQDRLVQRTPAALDLVSYWDAGSPGYRWNEIATAQTLKAGLGPGGYRTMALLNAAIYDATIAAWDSKYAHNRPRPTSADPSLTSVVPVPRSPSYPSEHAAAAGAAAAVLAFLFPTEASTFAALAAQAGESRLVAGLHYASDVAAGLELGRAVGARVVEWARADGSDAKWTGSVPVGPGLWQGDPVYPTMGTWKTWGLSSGSQLRPAPPPAFDSAQRAAELAEVKSYVRDANRGTELGFWPQDPAGRPAPDSVPFSSNQVVFYYAPVYHLIWGPELSQKLFEYGLNANPPRAARAYALVSIAGYDSTVAAWEAKYYYWTGRPIHFDSTITTVLPTYPIPDYPSGHSTIGAATGAVQAYLFPRDATFFNSRAAENAASRLWAGIHFRSANAAGLALGRGVAQVLIERARADGAT